MRCHACAVVRLALCSKIFSCFQEQKPGRTLRFRWCIETFHELSEEGLEAISRFADEGIKTNCTLIFSANQGLLAAKAGATTLILDGIDLSSVRQRPRFQLAK